MADRAENNKVPTRNAPNSDQEPQRSRGPDDRPTPPPRDEMNRKTAPGRDSAAPSSPDSAANRIRATESLFARTINDFCNKIGTELPIPNVRSSIANGGKTDKICSMRVLRILTLSGHLLVPGWWVTEPLNAAEIV